MSELMTPLRRRRGRVLTDQPYFDRDDHRGLQQQAVSIAAAASAAADAAAANRDLCSATKV